MSLLDDETIASTFARPGALTVACTAFTVRPLSGALNGICSLRTSFTTPTLMIVFGATCVGTAITTVLPTWRKSMVVAPADPPHVVVDVDLTARMVMVGMPTIPTLASATEALVVDLPGNPTVVTLAQGRSGLQR